MNGLQLLPVEATDAEALAGIRVAAMHASLSALGRFDAQRVRARLLDTFEPAFTRQIVLDGERAGFLVLRPAEEGLLLDHFYLLPHWQGRGLGSRVLCALCREADGQGLTLQLGALRGSAANRFYLRHGFVLYRESEWDLYYRRPRGAALPDAA